MSDADWDDEDYEPTASAGAPKVDDKWEGEDEEEDLKDNWDEESEDEEKKGEESKTAEAPKKKKSLKEKIAEKEAKRIAELEERKKAEEEALKQMSPEEIAAEKLRQQQIQEESDLALARDAFGVGDDVTQGVQGEIDAFKPESKDDFDKFKDMLQKKIMQSEKSPFYFTFVESLIRDLTINLEADELKKLGSQLSTLSSEKAKQQKATKGKKKKGASAKLNAGRDDNYDDYTVGGYDDFDDFI